MASRIEPCSSFLHPLNKNERKQSSNSINTGEKTSAIAPQILSNVTWHTELPSASNGKPPIINKISSEAIAIISSTCKQKPTPPPRSIKTGLNSTQGSPETNAPQKAFGPNLSDIVDARKALRTSEKKMPPKPLPRSTTTCLSPTPERSIVANTPSSPPSQKNKPKPQPVAVTDPTSPSGKRVCFQIETSTKNHLGTSSSEVLNTLPSKGILKKNTNTEPEEAPLDEWADVDKIFNECLKYLNDLSSSS